MTRTDDAGRVALVGLAFAVPVSTALANVLLALVFLCWLIGGRYRDKLRRFVDDPVALAALALFAWLLLSLAWVDSIGSDQRVFLRKYADLPLIAVFMWFMAESRYRAQALGGFAAAMLLTLLLSYAAAAGLLPAMGWLRAMPGNAVVFKLHITHGLLMALAALLFGLYAREAKTIALRLAWALASALAVVNVLFMVQGRTGYLVLGAFVVLALAARWRWRGLLAAGLLVGVGALVLYQVSPPIALRVDLAAAEFTAWDRDKPVAENNSVGRRLEFVDSSLALIQSRPWLGHGVGSFPSAYRAQVEGSGRLPTSNPHNEVLLLAVQGGLPAVLLFAFLLLRVGLGGVTLPTARERMLAAALVLWMLIGGLFNALLIDHTESLLFALLIGVLFGGARPLHSPPLHSPPQPLPAHTPQGTTAAAPVRAPA